MFSVLILFFFPFVWIALNILLFCLMCSKTNKILPPEIQTLYLSLSSFLGLFTSHFHYFVSLILMSHVFPSSFHQRIYLYILVAISAEIIIWTQNNTFRSECELVLAQRCAVFHKKRDLIFEEVALKKYWLPQGWL